ncbi:MAG TPA: hypothetical protein VFI91_08135 [Longimicrobiaceae bacterium]|nr:hypothetical protein [Longimicrobiaceae bacterium]
MTDGWTRSFTRAPYGVLILGALLFFAGGSLLLGGVYLAVAGQPGSIAVPVLAAMGGTLTVYVALRLLLLRRRAWSATIVLLILLIAYAAARAVMNPVPFPVYPIAEVIAEVVALVYLTRPEIRQLFA